jgi:hypothetical protein
MMELQAAEVAINEAAASREVFMPACEARRVPQRKWSS